MVKNDSLITYEKAFEGQAVIKKFFVTTFLERKIMSTKTSFKRIALVAASALALGGFSVISAPQASASADAFVLSSASTYGAAGNLFSANPTKFTASTVLDTRGVSAISVTAGDTVVLKFGVVTGTTTADDSITVNLDGYGDLITNDTITASIDNTKGLTNVFKIGNSNGATGRVITAPTTAGTYTLNITVKSNSTAGVNTNTQTIKVTMTVVAGTTYSNSLSSAYIAATNATPDSTSDAIAVSASKSLSATAAGNVLVTLKNADATAATSGNSLSATVTGPGYVTWSTSGAVACSTTPTYSALIGRAISAQTADDSGTLNICADGSSGTSTIKIEITDAAGTKQTLSTKTVTFFGSVASIAIGTKNFTIGRAGNTSAVSTGSATGAGTSDTITYMPAFTVVTKASDGTLANISSSGVPTIVSSATTVVASGICARDNDATYGSGATGYYGCSFTAASSAKSGDKATLTVRTPDPANTATGAYLTTTIDVTIGGSVAKEVISFDKSTYSTGEAMVVTITATDSSGNPVADGRTSPALTGSKAVGGALPAASYYVAGKKATTAGALWAPAIGGDFTVAGTGTDAAATAISAMVSIEGDASSSLALDAANAATDAANNAYDEAQNATQAASDALAAVTALAAQVKSLIASVKKLTAAVAKLKK